MVTNVEIGGRDDRMGDHLRRQTFVLIDITWKAQAAELLEAKLMGARCAAENYARKIDLKLFDQYWLVSNAILMSEQSKAATVDYLRCRQCDPLLGHDA